MCFLLSRVSWTCDDMFKLKVFCNISEGDGEKGSIGESESWCWWSGSVMMLHLFGMEVSEVDWEFIVGENVVCANAGDDCVACDRLEFTHDVELPEATVLSEWISLIWEFTKDVGERADGRETRDWDAKSSSCVSISWDCSEVCIFFNLFGVWKFISLDLLESFDRCWGDVIDEDESVNGIVLSGKALRLVIGSMSWEARWVSRSLVGILLSKIEVRCERAVLEYVFRSWLSGLVGSNVVFDASVRDGKEVDEEGRHNSFRGLRDISDLKIENNSFLSVSESERCKTLNP